MDRGAYHLWCHLSCYHLLTFSTLGFPEGLVTDNGPAFTSQEFANFIKANGIRHLTSLPYHPASNGPAERVVQTFFKAAIKKVEYKLPGGQSDQIFV